LSKPVSVDCAFGGMWYAIVDADLLAIDIEASKGGEIAKLGEKIKVTFFQLIFL
jgi:proline racemase